MTIVLVDNCVGRFRWQPEVVAMRHPVLLAIRKVKGTPPATADSTCARVMIVVSPASAPLASACFLCRRTFHAANEIQTQQLPRDALIAAVYSRAC